MEVPCRPDPPPTPNRMNDTDRASAEAGTAAEPISSLVQTRTYSTLEAARDDYRSAANSRRVALGLGLLLLLLSSALLYELSVGVVRREFVPNIEVFAPVAFIAGAFFTYVYARRVLSPGYATVTVGPGGVTFASLRGGRRSTLRWRGAAIKLRLDKRDVMGAVSYLDASDRLVLKALSEPAFLAILESARGAAIPVAEKKIWGGMVTRYTISNLEAGVTPSGPQTPS